MAKNYPRLPDPGPHIRLADFFSWLSHERKLLLIFLVITAIIGLLAFSAHLAFNRSEKAVVAVLHNNEMLRMVKDGNINLARAGQLPRLLESSVRDVELIRQRIDKLKGEFIAIGEALSARQNGGEEQRYVAEFLAAGMELYAAMLAVMPVKAEMMAQFSTYHGEVLPLYEILQERELKHVKFVHEISGNVEDGKQLSGGFDHRDCPLYTWLMSSPDIDADVSFIARDELLPLHESLHRTAAVINGYIARGDISGARHFLGQTRTNLEDMGNLFAGLSSLSRSKYQTAAGLFAERIKAIDEWYVAATVAVNLLEEHLQASMAGTTSGFMRMISSRTRGLVTLASVVGIVVCLLFGLYVIRRDVKLMDLAIRDGLTGLYNRRYLELCLGNECCRADRYQDKVCVTLLDIDFFKNVNDTYGHACGDLVLQEIAALLLRNLRPSDVAARYGGEEIAIITPATDLDGAVAMAEKMRRLIKACEFNCGGKLVKVSVSAGVAVFPDPDVNSCSSLLTKADVALYKAKNNGRDRVEILS